MTCPTTDMRGLEAQALVAAPRRRLDLRRPLALAASIARERRALSQLSARERADLGLSTKAADAEAARWFFDLPLARF